MNSLIKLIHINTGQILWPGDLGMMITPSHHEGNIVLDITTKGIE
jgi:hypothetical protein